MGFVIHWHESAMELHVFPIPIPPPTTLSTLFLWVFPVHQAQALVSCIPPGLVIYFTIDNIHAVLLKHPTLTFSHRVQKSVLYICVSFSVLQIAVSHLIFKQCLSHTDTADTFINIICMVWWLFMIKCKRIILKIFILIILTLSSLRRRKRRGWSCWVRGHRGRKGGGGGRGDRRSRHTSCNHGNPS